MDELIFEKKMLPGQTDNAGGREAVRPVKGGGKRQRGFPAILQLILPVMQISQKRYKFKAIYLLHMSTLLLYASKFLKKQWYALKVM